MNNNKNTQKLIKWRYRLSAQHYLRFISRLGEMSMSELSKRLVLRVRSISYFKTRYLQSYIWHSDSCGEQLVSAYSSDPVLKLSKQFDDNFFFGPSDQSVLISMLNQYSQSDIKHTIRLADDICDSGLVLLGCKVNPLANDFDWQADPVSGVRVWSEGWLDEAAAISAENADVKYVWEVNRHQFLPVLGRAYWISGDEKYVEKIVDVIDRWITSNPAGKGVNWCSHLEVSMRVISWLWVMPMLLESKTLDQKFILRWLHSIGQHYFHLKENLSEYTDPTNHLIGETSGLYMLCCCFPQLSNSQSEKKRTFLILEKELNDQNMADGVNKEQASSYHRFVLDFYIQVLLLAIKQNEPLSDSSEMRIMKMCEFQSCLAGFSGQAPMIGDSDDARGVPFPENFGWDFRDMPAVGTLLFDSLELASVYSELPAISVWLLGSVVEKNRKKIIKRQLKNGIKMFNRGGYCFMRNESISGEAELIFDTGPLGLWPNAAHAHADALNFIVRFNGNILLGDPGTGTYFGSEEIRNIFRKTSSHNTVTVDRLDQADIYGTFKWVNPYSTALEVSGTDCGFAYARASHRGYQRLIDSVLHTRSILSIGEFGWLILDKLSGQGAHILDWNYHFPPEIELTKYNSCTFNASVPAHLSGITLMILSAIPDNIEINHDNSGVWSTFYGNLKKSSRINVQTKSNLPVSLLTLLIPGNSDDETSRLVSDPVTYSRIGQYASVFSFTGNEYGEIQILTNPENEFISLPNIGETNAEILYLQKDCSGVLRKACITGKASYLSSRNLDLKCEVNSDISGYDVKSRENNPGINH